MRLRRLRPGRRNPEAKARALIELLWREETLELLRRHGIERGVKSKPRGAMWNRAAEQPNPSARGPHGGGEQDAPRTPPLLLACLRVTLGDDLDPCSSAAAKDRIGAGEWYSEQNGLSLPWNGSVHVFPPLERVGEFADKLLAELASGNVRRASFLGPADLRADWAVKLIEAPGFDGLVLERGRRSATAAGDRDQDVGRLALFLLGVGSSPAPKVFDGWGVPLSSMRGERKEGGKATAARPATEKSERPTERRETSNAGSSAPASDGTVVGHAAGVGARSTSRQTGHRVPQTEQRKAPNADSEVSRGGIADGSSARFETDRDKPSWLKTAQESRIGKRLRRVLAKLGELQSALWSGPSHPGRPTVRVADGRARRPSARTDGTNARARRRDARRQPSHPKLDTACRDHVLWTPMPPVATDVTR